MKSTPAGHKPLTQTAAPRAAGQAGGSSGANPDEMQVFGAQRKPVLPPRLLPLASPRHPTTAPDRSAWSGGGDTVQLLAGLSDGVRKGPLITGADVPLARGTRVTDGKTATWLLAELLTDAMDLRNGPVPAPKVFGLHYSFKPSSPDPHMPHLGRAVYNDAARTMLLGGNQGYMNGAFSSLFFAETSPDDVLATAMARDAADISDDEILFMQRSGKPGAVPPGYLVLLQSMPDEPGLRKLLSATLAFPASLRDIVSDYLTQPKTPHNAEGWRKLVHNEIVPVNGLLVMVCGRPQQQDGATTLDVFYPRTEGTQLERPILWDRRMLGLDDEDDEQPMPEFQMSVSPALPLEPALLRAHVGREPPRPAATQGDAKGHLRFHGHIYSIKLPDPSDYPREMPLPRASPGKPGPSAMTSWNPLASWRKPAVVKPTGTAASGGLDTRRLQLRNDRPETERRVQVTGKDGVTRTGNLQPIAEDGEVWITFAEADFSRKGLAEHGIRWAHTTTAGVISCLINPDSFKLEWVNP